MYLSPGLFAYLVLVNGIAEAVHEMPNDKVAKISDYSLQIRNKRGAYAAGFFAMKTLLDGARYIYTRGQTYGLDNVFIKPGGYRQALDDFERVYATNVKKSVEKGKIVEATGEVGNKMIILKMGDAKTRTTMTIKTHHATFPNNYKYYDPAGDQIIMYLD